MAMKIMMSSNPKIISVDGTKLILKIIDRYLCRLRNAAAASDGTVSTVIEEKDLDYTPFSSAKDVDEIAGCATISITGCLALLSMDILKLYLIQQTHIVQNSVYFLDRR
jgi:hypothetical protein